MPRYRQVAYSFGPPLTRAVKQLIIVTTAAFAVTYIPQQIFGWSTPYAWFALQPYDVLHRFYVWELASYLFLHWGFFHILFNMFALWMFGSDLESLWGREKFLFYYFLTGIGAGIFDVALNAIFPSATGSATVGASGAIYGLLLAYGLLFPDRPIYLYMLIPIKAKWFVVIMGVIRTGEFLRLPRVRRQPRRPSGRNALRLPLSPGSASALCRFPAAISGVAAGALAQEIRSLHAKARTKG